jgi:glc operon protein GlcG
VTLASILKTSACVLALAVAMPPLAQVPQYGSNVTLEQARKALTAAAAEARKNSWPVAIAIVDTAGQLVADERMDSTQTVSVLGSQDKAVSAAM